MGGLVSLVRISLWLNVVLVITLGVWFFLPKKSPSPTIKQDRHEINRLEAEIKELYKDLAHAQKAKQKALQRADSIAQTRTIIVTQIQKQNEKIDSIMHLPTLSDTALVQFFARLKASPTR
jgi:chromosome segregation ATPase